MSDFPAVVKLLRPFGDAVEEAGFECEIHVRSTGGDADRIVYRTGGYANDPPEDPDEDG